LTIYDTIQQLVNQFLRNRLGNRQRLLYNCTL